MKRLNFAVWECVIVVLNIAGASARYQAMPLLAQQRSRELRKKGANSISQPMEYQSNPYREATPLRVIGDAYVVAPYDKLTPGIQDQRGRAYLPPNYGKRAVYYSPSQDQPNPFPEKIETAPKTTRLDALTTECEAAPSDWVDIEGVGCDWYGKLLWCTKLGGVGPGWKLVQWGPISSWADKNGVDAMTACCDCGGGSLFVSVKANEKDIDGRRLVPAMERIPDPPARWFEETGPVERFLVGTPPRPFMPLQAPEDRIPLSHPPVAPSDIVPLKYARYFKEVHDAEQRPQPPGLSVRFYTAPPTASCMPVKASRIDHALDYSASTSYLSSRRLAWPVQEPLPAGVYFMKWTGTLRILLSGVYEFDLDIGWNTESLLKVDGVELLTEGQCHIAKDKDSCAAKKCVWNAQNRTCKPTATEQAMTLTWWTGQNTNAVTHSMTPDFPTKLVPGMKNQVTMAAGEHCIEATVMVTTAAKTIQLLYTGPDNWNRKQIIPSAVLFCDPVVKACTQPELDACRATTPKCERNPDARQPMQKCVNCAITP